MPIYEYVEILENGEQGEIFEVLQSMSDPALTVHPESGRPVERLISAPSAPAKTGGAIGAKADLSDRNLDRLGFTKYKKTAQGRYEKTVGSEGPDVIHKPQ